MNFGIPTEMLLPKNGADCHMHNARAQGAGSQILPITTIQPGEVLVMRYAAMCISAIASSGTARVLAHLQLTRGIDGITPSPTNLLTLGLVLSPNSGDVVSQVIGEPLLLYGGNVGTNLLQLNFALASGAITTSEMSANTLMWPLHHDL